MSTTSDISTIPSILGLILAGGYSTRMGSEKYALDFHGLPQYQYLADLLQQKTDAVFISCRQDQVYDFSLPRIEDAFEDIGPLAGVLSAFQKNAACAWLVVACDMPYINAEAISCLISHRDPSKQATYFIDPKTSLPEPLFTIFEPSILPVMLQAFHSSQFSLNKILQGCNGNGIATPDEKILRSVNSKEEMKVFMEENRGSRF